MMSASCNNLPDYDSRIMPLFQWIRHPFFNNYRLLFPAGLLLLFIVTAYFSQGYYHADEQYQIIEFAGLKLGTHQPEDLAWEFKHRLRSAAQPALCYAHFSFFSFPGIADPYLLAFLLRAFTGLVAVLCITFFIRKSKSFVPDEDNSSVLWMFVAGLWFIPFLSFRFSSETLSGLMILTASAFLLKAKSNRSALAAGLFFGLAFLFRFQSSVIILFVVFWMWRYHRLRAGQWFLFFSGIATLCLAGVVLDRWFYGSLTFTPLNYLANALDSGGGNFGAEPWYFYIEKLITYTGIPAGMLLLCSLFFLLWKKDFYAALTVVFLLFHSFIPHKEERFIFPVAFLFPYLLARFYVEFPRMVSSVIKEHVLKKGLIIILLSFSLPALVCNSLKPAGIGNIAITDYIHTHYAGKAVRLFHLPWSNPYNPWDGLPIRFYLDGNVQFAKMENLNAWDTLSLAKEEIPLLVVRKTDLKNNEGAQKIAALGFREVKQSVPAWIQSMNRMFYRQLEEQHVLVLYALQNEK